jgi:uncharacterized protein (DUF1499 family)
MVLLRLLVLLVLVTAVTLVAAGQLGLLRGKMPTDLGVKDGRLKRPSKTENSVSSQADLFADHPMRAYAQIDPLAFSGDAQAAWTKLKTTVASLPHTQIVTDTDQYLYAQSSTRWLRFTDDVEFLLDAPAGVIHVRSASRLGRKDFGVNRARVEAIRAGFAALQP